MTTPEENVHFVLQKSLRRRHSIGGKTDTPTSLNVPPHETERQAEALRGRLARAQQELVADKDRAKQVALGAERLRAEKAAELVWNIE